MIDDSEMKPCPWCGEQWNIQRTFVSDAGYSGMHAAYCGKCWSQGPLTEKRDQAIPAWNTRAEVKGE